ncbi:MAG: bifunctional UDP-N-acetylglucosamine diphosphorylase/glucosamine-1-phosphate N-acetyltransferase GlmU [Leptolinea sp.]
MTDSPIISAIILAAGQGTRMKSNLPKVLHPLSGRPLIQYALEAVQGLTANPPVVVIGHGAEMVRLTVGSAARFVIQQPQLGTAHAVMAAEPILEQEADYVIVTYADMPLIRAETIKQLTEAELAFDGPITMLTGFAEDPRGFGRVERAPDGSVQAIVEEAVASAAQLAIHELNLGIYCFKAVWLWGALKRIKVSPKGEYYLTDVVAIAREDGLKAQAIVLNDFSEAIGINNRVHLAEAEALLKQRINRQWMEFGVSIIDPASTFIGPAVRIGQDTTIWPNTHLRGDSVIGEETCIGPNCIIEDAVIGSRCNIQSSVIEKAVVEDEVSMGPFAHLRKGAHLMKGVHMGNFGEVKDSTLHPGVKIGHFSYIGNADIGDNTNIGAGTITCNFDGTHKHPTVIGANAFIGSDTMLVAPLNIGENARTGAGSVVTKDVPAGVVVLGVPARPYRKVKKSD